ncbi:MAG: chemotaxis protein CheC [Candidatus Eisenbacteria sp.]|nr:chemotaxis protein CheC [Candidatus Eisenbacteria bacterium]
MSITAEHRDILAELINVGLGHAAGQLNDMFGLPVALEIPSVDLLLPNEVEETLREKFGARVSAVSLDFSGSLVGTASLVLPTESALRLISALDEEDMDAVNSEPMPQRGPSEPDDTLEEVGNILINSVLGAVANGLGQHLVFSVPETVEDPMGRIAIADNSTSEDSRILFAQTGFSIKHLLVSGSITLLFQIGSVDALLEAIDNIDLDT